MSEETTNPVRPKAQRGVLCAKCDHLNPPGLDTCEYCHAHLFLSCKSCGQRNERVRTRCTKCGHRLHRGWGHWITNKFSKNNLRYFIIYLPITVLAGYITYRIIVFIVER